VRITFNSSIGGTACTIYVRWGSYDYTNFSTIVDGGVFEPDTKYDCWNFTTTPAPTPASNPLHHIPGIASSSDEGKDDADEITGREGGAGEDTGYSFYSHINSRSRTPPMPEWWPSLQYMEQVRTGGASTYITL
jgi:hypothetical protein